MHNKYVKILLTVFLIGASTAAVAHPGHNVSGITAGLLHPFSGMDHLLAMLAVGLWAAQGGKQKIWLLPAVFMVMLVVGASIGMQWSSLTQVETGIAISVLCLGLLVSLSLQLPVDLSVMMTAVFGLFHGYAHGVELPLSAAPVSYAMGFLVATVSLHLAGIGAGVATRRHFVSFSRFLGGVIALSGVYLLAAT